MNPQSVLFQRSFNYYYYTENELLVSKYAVGMFKLVREGAEVTPQTRSEGGFLAKNMRKGFIECTPHVEITCYMKTRS